MSRSPRQPDRVVLRPPSSLWIFGFSVLLGVYLLVDAAVRARFDIVLVALPWLALGAWLIWVLLVRPCVIVTRESLQIVNVWRRFTIPWPRVHNLTSRFQLTVHLTDGTVVKSWGAPTAGVERAPRFGSFRSRGMSLPKASTRPVDVLIERWRSVADDDAGRGGPAAAVTRRTDLVVPGVTLVLAIACASVLPFALA